MICARCDQPIMDGDEYETVENPGASGSGDTLYRHTYRCRRAQLQTGPRHFTQLPPYQPRWRGRRL